jgi:hypothetical protein
MVVVMYKVGDRVIVTDVHRNYADCKESDTGTIIEVDKFGPNTYLVKVDNPNPHDVEGVWGFEGNQLLPILAMGRKSVWNH